MYRVVNIATIVCVFIGILGGCSRTEEINLLENAGFTVWNGSDSMPVGWFVEGNGLRIKKSDSIVDNTGDSVIECEFFPEGINMNSPFLYQRIKAPERLAGKHITLGGWVKTSTPNAVVIEFSNRAGTDLKSPPHPGDGEWKYLSVSTTLPDDVKVVEFRLRFYAPAQAMFGGVNLTEDSWFL